MPFHSVGVLAVWICYDPSGNWQKIGERCIDGKWNHRMTKEEIYDSIKKYC